MSLSKYGLGHCFNRLSGIMFIGLLRERWKGVGKEGEKGGRGGGGRKLGSDLGCHAGTRGHTQVWRWDSRSLGWHIQDTVCSGGCVGKVSCEDSNGGTHLVSSSKLSGFTFLLLTQCLELSFLPVGSLGLRFEVLSGDHLRGTIS